MSGKDGWGWFLFAAVLMIGALTDSMGGGA